MSNTGTKICESMEYMNNVCDIVLGIDTKELTEFYEALRESDCIIEYGAGRSHYGFKIVTSEMAKMGNNRKVIMTPEDTGFPGANMYDAAPMLEKRYDKINLLINSGSGESKDPKNVARQLVNYIEKTNSKKFLVSLITSNKDSTLGKCAQKYGHLITLKDANSHSQNSSYRDIGIMKDRTELASMFILQILTQILYDNADVSKFYPYANEEFSILGKAIDDFIGSEFYKSLIDDLERRSDVFLGGRSGADEVASMTAIRVAHVKHAMGDNVYTLRGVNTPKPRAKDIGIFISHSGGKIIYPGELREETSSVVDWSKDFHKLGALSYSLIASKNSPLEEYSDYKFVLEEKIRVGQPKKSYMRFVVLLSPVLVSLCERLKSRGFNLPPDILAWYHTVAE